MFRFDFTGLTLSQRIALSWLIAIGGTARQTQLISDANGAQGKRLLGKVTKATIDSLVRREYLERHPLNSRQVQITPWAVTEACRHYTNPHPDTVMPLRLEADAWREHDTHNHHGE